MTATGLREIAEPRANALLRGHEAAEATLAGAVAAGRLHHGWLITGPEGVGKATLAFRFARWLLAGAPSAPAGQGALALDPNHPVFRRVAAAGHADLLSLALGINEKTRRPRREMVVDDVAPLAEFLHLTAAEGGWRVVVIDQAEALNRNAANALLKTLEEPPRRAVLLLACAAPGRLPATLRSRCRLLRLQPLAQTVLADLLATYLPDRDLDARMRLASLAEGSPGRALRLAEAGGIRLADLAAEALAGLPLPSLARASQLADALGRDETAFSTFFDMLRSSIAAMLRAQARGELGPEQARLAALHPPAVWERHWQALGALQAETEGFALDRRQAVVAGLGLLSGQG